jgi:hypothetical protein
MDLIIWLFLNAFNWFVLSAIACLVLSVALLVPEFKNYPKAKEISRKASFWLLVVGVFLMFIGNFYFFVLLCSH